MRQAGRYLPEYRATRAHAGSFLDLCLTPPLATEVTLQPIHRFDFDAAILFADILVVPYALGRRVAFVEGEGPVLDPIDVETVGKLDPSRVLDALQPIFETVAMVRRQLAPEKSLIGFCGAPWTVATYMVAGRGGDQAAARLTAVRHTLAFEKLIDCLVEASIAYLVGQFRAGVDAVQIFDSWAGALGPSEFIRWCLGPTARIVAGLRSEIADARVIGFPKGAGFNFEAYATATGVDCVGIDWTVPLDFAKRRIQPKVAVQGNLDPVILLAGGDALDRSVDAILAALGHGRFIFNLGHGILPETPVAHVERLVKRVRGR